MAYYFLFYFQIVGLLSWLAIPYWYEHLVITLLIYFLASCLGGTMTYHRLLAHKSWNCPKPLMRLFVLFQTITMTGSAIAWVSLHREHHKYSDSKNDPHSPYHKGLFKMHFMSMFEKPKVKYAKDLLKDKFLKFQHEYYLHINIVYALILLSIDPWALIYAWLAPAALVWNANSLIISYSHKDGVPSNNFLLGLITFGEGWHLNHHNNSKLKKMHKYDIGGIIIESIEKYVKT